MVKKKEQSFLKRTVVNKKILKKEPLSTLDLRGKSVEVPIKKAHFKEMEISSKNILNQ